MKPLTLTLLALFFGLTAAWAYQPEPCCEPAHASVRDISTDQRADGSAVVDRSMQKERLRLLAGMWVNTHPNLKLESPCGEAEMLHVKHAEVQYDFQEDGTFHKVLTSRVDPDLRLEETGRWKVSADGKELHLFRTTADGDLLVTQADIKYVELDELVLSHPVASIGEREVLNADTDLFFNKH